MKKSGVVSRFGLKLISNSSGSSDNDDAMPLDGNNTPLRKSPIRSQHEEDSSSAHESGLTVDRHSSTVLYTTVESIELAPSTSIAITQRQKFWNYGGMYLSTTARAFMSTFCHVHEMLRQDPKYFDLMLSDYRKMCTIPRFAARFQRLATALLAGWMYYLSPTKAQSIETRKEAVSNSISQLIETYIMAVGLLHGQNEAQIRENQSVTDFIGAIVAYDGIVRRCYANSLRFKRQKLCQACLVFLGDVMYQWRYTAEDSISGIVKDLLPSITNTVDKVLATILPPETVSTAVPSDIPLSAFDGSVCDMFENDERIRLYLIAPKRVPFTLMASPPSSHFAYATLPNTYDDYAMPGMLTTNSLDPRPEHPGDGDFINNARVKTAEYLRTAKNLVQTSQGRSLLPLCAVSVMDKAIRNDGLHNEDRWWVTNFVSDTADFDIEDLGDLFDVFAGRSADKYTRRFKHMMAHRGRYNEAIAKTTADGFPPLVSTSCKTMNNLTYERSERRGAYCPFVATNHATADEIRQLLKWQGLNFDEESIESIVEFAAQGNQAEGCLAHYNAILKARGDKAIRQKVIKMPPIFAQLQAMRRDGEQDAKV